MKPSLHVALMRHIISTHELKTQLQQSKDSSFEPLTNYACQYLDQCNQAIRELAEQSWRAQR